LWYHSNTGVVQKVLVPGHTENRQSLANKEIPPRFDGYLF